MRLVISPNLTRNFGSEKNGGVALNRGILSAVFASVIPGTARNAGALGLNSQDLRLPETEWRWVAAKKRDCSLIILLLCDYLSIPPHMFVKTLHGLALVVTEQKIVFVNTDTSASMVSGNFTLRICIPEKPLQTRMVHLALQILWNAS